MDGKHLGKIDSFRVGFGGYQDAQFGYWFTLRFDKCCGVGGGEGPWATEVSSHTKWTEADRSAQFDRVMRDLWKFLEQSKKREVHELVGVPVEVTMEGNMLKSWRILEEVL